MSGHKDEGKQPSGYKLTGVALAILVMGVSLTAIIIAYLSFGYMGSKFSNAVLENQQEELRERYGLPPLQQVTPQEAEIPPSLRDVTTVANTTEGSNAANTNATAANITANQTTVANTTTTANATSANNQTTTANATGPAANNATGSRGTAANAAAVSVSIVPNSANLGDKAFSPNPANVKTGGTVTWRNDDTVLHTVKSGTGPSDPDAGSVFDSGFEALQSQGDTFSHTFSTQGTFPYFCEVHPTMVGEVIVS